MIGPLKYELSKNYQNWAGARGLVPHASSHTTVQAVPHTAVPCFDTSDGCVLLSSAINCQTSLMPIL